MSLTTLGVLLLPVALGLLFLPAGRFFLTVLAGLVVFTPGYASEVTKLTFVGVLGFATVVALLRLRDAEMRLGGPLKVSAALYAAALLFAGVVGWTDNVAATFQQGLPYVLLLLMLPIATYAGLRTKWRMIELGLIVFGLLSTMSFTVFWLGNRSVSVLDSTELFASSLLLPALTFQWGLVSAGDSSRSRPLRLFALACSFAIPIALFLTGTRSTFVLGFGLAGFLIWAVLRRRMFGTGVTVGLALAITPPILGWLASVFLKDPTFIERRLTSLLTFLSSGLVGDSSWEARRGASDAARAVLDGHWLTGLGLSAPTPVWLKSFDTPLSIVMRLGVIGTLFLVLYLAVALRWAMKTAPAKQAGNSVRAIIVGWSLTVVGYAALASPIEDPMFAFAFAIIIALAVSKRQENVWGAPPSQEPHVGETGLLGLDRDPSARHAISKTSAKSLKARRSLGVSYGSGSTP